MNADPPTTDAVRAELDALKAAARDLLDALDDDKACWPLDRARTREAYQALHAALTNPTTAKEA